MGAIGQRSQAVQQFASGARITFGAIAARDNAFRGLLREAPFAIAGNATIGVDFIKYSPQIVPVLNNLSTTVLALKPAIELLTPGAQNGLQVVNALGAASPTLKNVLVNLEKLKPSATSALPGLHSIMCQLNPMLRFLKPYGPDISAFLENFGGLVNAYGNAHTLVAQATVDPSALVRGVETQPGIGPALSTLLNFGIFKLAGANTGYSALPGPGHMYDTTSGLGGHGPIDWGATHPFPHVTADCSK
jgi:hypothetical protein